MEKGNKFEQMGNNTPYISVYSSIYHLLLILSVCLCVYLFICISHGNENHDIRNKLFILWA